MAYTLRKTGLVMIGLLIMLVIAACGNEKPADPGSEQPASEQGNTQAQGQEQEQGQETGQEQGQEQEQAAAEEGGQRTFTDDYGHEITLEQAPERILGVYLEDPLVALGVKPLLQFNFGGGGAAYLQAYIGDVPLAGDSPMPNPEWVLDLKPDLIITHSLVLPADKREPYAKIAPTYSIDAGQSGWKEILSKIGELLGKSEQVVELMQQYDQQIAEAKEKLSQQVGQETFALVRIAKEKDIRVYRVNDPFSGELLFSDLGLTPHPMVATLPEDGNISISMEVISELDADHIILVVNDNGRGQAEELAASPLWKNLPAFKNNHVYEVDPSLWLSLGYMANTGKVQDLLQRLGIE